MSRSLSRRQRNLLVGLSFLAPNILGFLAFTLVPLVMSLILAFSNWDLRLHNMFRSESIRYVGTQNFQRLLSDADFWRFLGNTLFLMIGIPFTIAGSLGLAVLLSKDLGGGRGRGLLIATALMVCAGALLALAGSGATAITLLVVGLFSLILMGGLSGGSPLYRTLFYLPHFTSGVAVYLLWSKLYSPNNGPINAMLAGPLRALSDQVRQWPGGLFDLGGWLLMAATALAAIWAFRKMRQSWRDGELGTAAGLLAAVIVVLPVVLAQGWLHGLPAAAALAAVAVAALMLGRGCLRGRDFTARAGEGFGAAAMLALAVMALEFVFIGLSAVVQQLPAMVSQAGPAGLTPPKWLSSVDWAKPAIMIMGVWLGVGSNNMLLYLAGLSNVPLELYEAADIDGASRLQKFWNVTWPQLAPTTFFIVVMSTISGLQGGFEMARTMTKGGPAGSTTTLAYFVFTEGFATGRLGFSSATAWTLFAMVLGLTIFNWKFGNRYVND